MGNRPANAKPALKNQAAQVLSSGEPKGGSIGTGNVNPKVIIPLTHLNLSLLEKIRVGDRIRISWEQGSFCAFKRTEILGKVPANYNSYFTQSKSYSAKVFSFRKHPPAVSIEIIK